MNLSNLDSQSSHLEVLLQSKFWSKRGIFIFVDNGTVFNAVVVVLGFLNFIQIAHGQWPCCVNKI